MMNPSQGPMPGPSQRPVLPPPSWTDVDGLRHETHELQARYNDLLALHTATVADLVEARAEVRHLKGLLGL